MSGNLPPHNMTQLRISSQFDSGAIEVLRLDDPNDIRLRIRPDNAAEFAQWFHFRLLGAQGQKVTLRFMNAGQCAYPSRINDAMLLTKEFFKGFTAKPIVDARQGTEMLLCLSCESRAELDAMVAGAVAAGGSAPRPPIDHGFMYAHGFEDLDGHI